MDYMAADLRARGVAVWNLEYRRIGHPGGGYPGTFADVSAGVDHLRRIAGEHRLDLGRVVLSGHSAGGHLALWAASRAKLPAASPLRVASPLPVRGVVTLAGINDLEAYRATGPQACGGPPTIDGLVGAPGARADVYADTSPPRFAPLAVRQVVVSGALDPIVPPRFGEAYATAAAARGDRVLEVTLPRAGHFELIDPTAAAWTRIRGVMDAMLAPERRR
jgi:acetyl esterase/lipase